MGEDRNLKTLYLSRREEWRKWLEENFETEKEIWLVFPNRLSGKPALLYNDAVEEALCFGWIDSTVKRLDEDHTIQWFLPRKNKSYYSTANRERLKWLWKHDLIHPKIKPEIETLVKEVFVFPDDIVERLKEEEVVWENYRKFSESYKRLRVGYIDSARKNPEEFEKRLSHFMNKTRANKLIRGHGGIEKYY